MSDSTHAPGTGAAVYIEARAAKVPRDASERCLAVYAGRSVRDGLEPWGEDDVRAPARHRLYRAAAMAYWALGALDERLPVDIDA